MKKKIILIGSGGHATSCVDVIESTEQFEICGFVSEDKKIGSKFLGYPILSNLKNINIIKKITKNVIIAFGSIYECNKRSIVFDYLKKKDFNFQTIISPNSYLSKRSSVKAGTIIMHGANVNANVKIGENCIINSNSLIEHDVSVGFNSHISTSATINGGVKIRKNCFIGSRSVIKENIIISDNSFIKMGSIITKNI